MSANLECEFFESEPGKWFYALEDWSAPQHAWDWREFSTSYGPFPSYEEAQEHLRRNHANPGGHTVTSQDHFEVDEVYLKLIDEARL